MKFAIGAALLLGSAGLLSGCAGFWDPPASGGGGGGSTPTTLSSGIFYVLNQKTSQVVGYSINTGKLVSISGGTQTLPAGPFCIAIAPSGGFLYVGTVNGIYLYTIGSSGALTIANNGAPVSSDIASAIAVDGSWLVDAFATTNNNPQLDAIPINPANGVYTGGGGSPPTEVFSNISNASVSQMALSPDGTYLFVALGKGGTIVVPFNAGNSNPLGTTAIPIGVLKSNGSALSVAVDPQARFFYIGETLANSAGNSGGLRAFNYSSLSSGSRGLLTQVSGSPVASGGLAPNAILPLDDGSTVYVANGGGTTAKGNIAWFPITASGTSYSIAAGSAIATGVQPVGLAEDNQANFILAVSSGGSTSSGNPDLGAYTISSGALTSALTSTTGTDPVGAIAIAAMPQ